MNSRELIARRVAGFFEPGDVINLGAGIPVFVKDYLPADGSVIIQTENGFVGITGKQPDVPFDRYCTDASEMPIGLIPGGCTMDSAMAFGIVRGGHLTASVLGAMQVDPSGNLANWAVPGGKVVGMGGAMDLTVGAKLIIVAMEHCAKDGRAKIVNDCTYPITAYGVVSKIVTELAYFEVTDKGLLLKELGPGVGVEEVREKTEADFAVADDLREMSFGE